MKKKAFTLIEVLIVLMIIGALGGVLYIAFGGTTDVAEKAACQRNCEAIQTAYSLYKFSGGDESLEKFVLNETYKQWITNDGAGCPSDGGYIIDEHNSRLVTCSLPQHKIIVASFGNTETMANLTEIMQDIGKGNHLDSLAAEREGSYAAKVLPELKKAGMDLVAMGAVSWRYDNSGNKFLYWSTQDIRNMAAGDKVPVMRYNLTTGTYTVWTATIVVNTQYNPHYNSLGAVGSLKAYAPSTSQPKEEQTYENCRAHYDAYMKQQN